MARLECVVPFTMKSMGLQPERTHLLMRDLLARLVLTSVEQRDHSKPGLRISNSKYPLAR
jgi:hypothetical protein